MTVNWRVLAAKDALSVQYGDAVLRWTEDAWNRSVNRIVIALINDEAEDYGYDHLDDGLI